MTKKYSVVRVKLLTGLWDDEHWEQLIATATSQYRCQGVVEFDLNEKEIDEVLGRRAYAGVNLPDCDRQELEDRGSSTGGGLQFYFYEEGHQQDAANFTTYLKNNHQNLSCEQQLADWEDWNQGARDNFSRIQLTDELEVVPAWEYSDDENNGDGSVKLYINPGMGFGTGTHETTALCLLAYDQFLKDKIDKGDRCLDFGCGSGILGIATIKINQMNVDFCDIDTEALDNCQQNILLNFPQADLSGHRLVSRQNFRLEQPYKLVFANILESVLVEEKKLIVSSVGPGGFLILSGVLDEQMDGVRDLYCVNDDYTLLHSEIRGEWGVMLLQREESK